MPTAQSLPDSASTIASGSTKMTPPNLATSSSPPRVTEPLASNQQPAQSTTNTATNNPFVVSAEDLLLSVPTPVIRLLIILSRPIAFLRKSIQVLLWRSTSPVESWLVVGSFWALALGGRSAWMYFLPPILVIPFLPLPTSPTLRPLSVNMRQSLIEGTTQSQPATTQTLLLTLSHLYAINGMISSTSVDLVATPGRTVLDYLQEWNEIEKKRLIRGGLILWIGWILANTLLGGRITFALLGSLVLLWPSPARKSLHGLCGKSLFLRRLATLAFLVIFGSPPVPEEVTKSKKGTRVVLVGDDAPEESRPPTTTFSVTDWMKDKWTTSRRPSFAFRLRPYGRELQSSSLTGSALAADDTDISSSSTTTNAAQGADAIAPSPPIYFRFELHENQRWWMGLDWTSALLPQERPSWCDMYLNPASPPSSFTLPGETVIYLPDPRKGDPNRRVKRTAKWRWIDEDWSAVKRTGKEALRSETAGGAGAVAGAGAGSGAGVGVGGGSGELGTPAHIRKSSSASLDIAENHAQAPAHASSLADKTTTTKGLAEQAFVKGLEKLKARTMSVQVGGGSGAGSGGIAGMGLGVRPHSGDFSHLNPNINTNSTDDSKHGDKAAGPGRPSEQTRKSSLPPPSDLSTMLGAATAFGHPLNPSSTGGQFGPTNNMLNQNVLAMLGDLDVGTDADGWSYGDNKWEGMGPKGGMGRYTRRRRWQRRAMCIETIEYIEGIPAHDAKTSPPVPTAPEMPQRKRTPDHSDGGDLGSDDHKIGTPASHPDVAADERRTRSRSQSIPVREGSLPPVLKLGSQVEGYNVSAASPSKSLPAATAASASLATVTASGNRTVSDVISSIETVTGSKNDTSSTVIPEADKVSSGGSKIRTGSASATDRDQALRQRLRNAMGSVGA